MTTLKYTSRYGRLFTLILGSALAFTQLQATDYTWNSGVNERWGTATNWDPEGLPGTGDNVIGTNFSSNLEITANETIDNFTYGGGVGAWQLVGIGDVSLTINDTLALTGTDNLAFRKSTGDNGFDLTTNNISVTNTGILVVGAGNSVNNVRNLTVNGTTTVSNGQVRFNIENDYSIGTVDVSGNGRIYLSSSPQNTGAIQATATGLTGSGGTIQSALFTGNSTTLRINGSGNYSSGTNLVDNEGTLSLIMDGAGNQTLTGNNQYTGKTQVDDGTLTIGSSLSLGLGDVIVNGGTLTSTAVVLNVSGNFTIKGGQVDINGLSTGICDMTAGQDLTLDGGTIVISYDSGVETHDRFSSAGSGSSFDLSSGIIDLANSDWDYSIVYTLFEGFDSGTVGDIDFINYDTSNWQASLSDTGVLSFSAIPEPSASMIILPAFIGLFAFVRRRRA